MFFKWLFNLRKYDSTRLLFLSCNTMSMKYLLHDKIMQFYGLLWHPNVSLTNLILLNYDKRYMLFNEYCLPMYAESQTIKRHVDTLFMNYCKEKL